MRGLLERREYAMLVLSLAAKACGGVLKSKLRLVKLFFLVQKEAKDVVEKLVGSPEPYSFEPYLHGPFSRELLEDVEKLAELGLVHIDDEIIAKNFIRKNYVLTSKGVEVFAEIEKRVPRELLEKLKKLVERYAKMDLDDLLNYVYSRYPEDSTPLPGRGKIGYSP